jgi:glycosyltransferase involved in cell wall biosynthesis
MKILHVHDLNSPLSRDNVGGAEEFIFILDRQLIKDGHQSAVVANEKSHLYKDTNDRRLVPFPGYIFNDDREQTKRPFISGEIIATLKHATIIKEITDNKYDVMHNHYIRPSNIINFHEVIDIPIVTTMHTPEPWNSHMFGKLELDHERNKFVAISHAQKRILEKLGYKIDVVIHNGINVDYFEPYQKTMDHYLFMGRMDPVKAPEYAIEATRKADKQILVVGGINPPDRITYFNKKVKPLINYNLKLLKQATIRGLKKALNNGDNQAVYFGHVLNKNKNFIYGNAKALLFTIRWEEPFGLVLIESLSCGTPVIAFAKGSVPEVIKDGETGFIVNPSDNDIRGNWIVKKTGTDGLAEAIQRIESMSESEYSAMRKACRKSAEDHFSIERIVEKYTELYEEVIKK